METEIKEAFEYLSTHAGGLSILERELIKGFQQDFNESGMLDEMQTRSLLELRKWREKSEKHLY